MSAAAERGTAVIMGGGRGMAFDAGRILAHHGYRVVLADVDRERAELAASTIGPDARGYGVDSTDRVAVQALADEIVGDDGDLEILISAVGGSAMTPRWIDEIEPEHVGIVVDLCVASAYNAVDVFGPALRRAGGSIVLVSSSAARLGDRSGFSPVYAFGKGAVFGLIRWIAIDPEWMGVRANAVSPGDVLTERTLELFAQGRWTVAEQEVIRRRRNSLGRMAKSEELGYSIAAIALDTFASGAIYDVTGGEYPTPT